MFSGIRKLGESQELEEDVQDRDEGSDIDLITTNYLSPDSGYPPQRISDYDEQLVQHQTLNDHGLGQGWMHAFRGTAKQMMSKTVAPDRGVFLTRAMGPLMRTPVGMPRTGRSAAVLAPRFRTLLMPR